MIQPDPRPDFSPRAAPTRSPDAAIGARLEATLGQEIVDAGGRRRAAGEIVELLAQAGITAWLAGGAVRDAVRGGRPQDVDMVADAHISHVRALIAAACGEEAILLYNEAIGSLRLGATADAHFDIGMFRDIESIEGYGALAAIGWGLGDMASDARTTDFTMNALYWHPGGPVFDPTGRGYADALAGLLELSSDPRKTALDHRLSLRLALFGARGYRPTPAASAFFRARIDRDAARFGDALPTFMSELDGGSAARRQAILAFCAEHGASPRTLAALGASAAPSPGGSFWGSMDNFA